MGDSKPFIAIRAGKLCFPQSMAYIAFSGGEYPSIKKRNYIGGDEVIKLWEQVEGGRIAVPRNLPVNAGLRISDGTKPLGDQIDYRMIKGFRPRDHQSRVFSELLAKGLTDVIIRMPCGAGKTVFASMLVAHFRLRTLVIVPTKQLQNQFRDELRDFSEGSWEEGEDIVVSTVQSAHKLGDDFDIVIADEAHTIAAETWGETIQKFSSKYRIALTATPFRSDGTTERMRAIFGQQTLVVSEEELEAQNLYNKPSVIVALFRNEDPVRYAMRYEESEQGRELVRYYSSAKTYNALSTNAARQVFIANIVRKAEKKGRKTLTLYNRVKGIESLATRISGLRPGIVRSKAKFEEELKRDHVVGISSMVTQGLNKKTLDTMIMASPFSSKGVLEQMYGRLTRPFGNPGLFFDIVDSNLNGQTFGDKALARREAKRKGRDLTPLESSALRRIDFYKSKGMKVTIMSDGKYFTLT